MTRISGPGTFNMTAEEYHADPAPAPSLSSTIARTLLSEAPLHAWFKHPRLNPYHVPEIKDSFEIGRAAHAYLTGQGEDGIHVLSHHSYRTKAAQQERDDARDDGFTVLLDHQYAELTDMIAAARFQLERHQIGDVFETGKSEQAHFAQIDGVWCRAMTDCIAPSEIVYDYKTTASSAQHDAAVRTISQHGYDVQAAHYLDVLAALDGKPRRFRFIFQEKAAPYALSVIEIGETWLTDARQDAKQAREHFRRCLDTFGTSPWPGYAAEIVVVDEPPWRARAREDRQTINADLKADTGRDLLDRAMKWQAP